MRVFAQKHGIKAPRLYYWKTRLQAISPASSSLALVPATVISDDASIAIRLPDGVSIAVSSASPTWVAALVMELVRSP